MNRLLDGRIAVIPLIPDHAEKPKKLSIIMPCWGRPQRTRRAIASVVAQDCHDWELLCVGDCCPVLAAIAEEVHNPNIIFHNMPTHEGKYGTQCLNYGLSAATGDYVCFMGNDDFLAREHVRTRLLSIMQTGADLVYHDALILKDGQLYLREGHLRHGCVGGSELVVKTELARKVGFRSGDYGHDWTFIVDCINIGARVSYWKSATYVVTHLPGTVSESGID